MESFLANIVALTTGSFGALVQILFGFSAILVAPIGALMVLIPVFKKSKKSKKYYFFWGGLPFFSFGYFNSNLFRSWSSH